MRACLSSLPFRAERVVIINCGTKFYSALALASIQRHSSIPVLMVDCESKDGSMAYFEALQGRVEKPFELIQMQLRPHGATLDDLFSHIASETVVLADSDIELMDAGVLRAMVERSAVPDCYGAGLLHKGSWMTLADHAIADGACYYAERMWIPFTLLKVDAVRRVLAQGGSFLATTSYRQPFSSALVNRLLAKRFRLPLLRRCARMLSSNLWNLAAPDKTEYDTGAKLHELLKAQGLHFEAIDDSFFGAVHHYHGATRAALASRLSGVATALGILPRTHGNSEQSSLDFALDRIKARYPEYLF
jgi:hypothetical protein